MAVQIINDMPDFAVHRGDPLPACLREIRVSRAGLAPPRGRAIFLGITLALHAVAALAFMQMTYGKPAASEPVPIEVALIESPQTDEPPPQYTPPPMNVTYALPTPPEVVFESETLSNAITTSPTATSGETTPVAPPMVESVEYVRTEPPVYPRESQRKHEYGTVVLRVLVDALGRPAQIQVERSSGYSRLDAAARAAVEKFLFRPYEVNGIAQPAQVLIPIGFDRRSS